VIAEERSPDQLFIEVRSNRGPIEKENL